MAVTIKMKCILCQKDFRHERLQKLKDDARAALEEIQARIDACEAAQ